MDSFEDRISGVLFGLAAGDQIGGPIRMALIVAESVHERGQVDHADLQRRYLEWWRAGGFDTGGTAARVFDLADSGLSFDDAALQTDRALAGQTAGCNPAHRSAPLAMCAAIADDRLAASAIAEAHLTHRHPLAGETAAAVVVLCRLLIRAVPWTDALRLAAQGRCAEIRAALDPDLRQPMSRGGFAPEVLRAAVCILDEATSFPQALRRAIEFAGPVNYCPVVVGSIGGARWGRAQIDAALLKHHAAILGRVESAAHALAGAWNTVPRP